MDNIENWLIKSSTDLPKIVLLVIIAAYTVVLELTCFGIPSVCSQPLPKVKPITRCSSLKLCWSVRNTDQSGCTSDKKNLWDSPPGQLHITADNGTDRVEPVAVKVLKHKTTSEVEEDFMREVKIMSSFKHTNILNLIGLCPRESTSSPWMVFEFMKFGDLASVLRNSSFQTWSRISSSPALSPKSLLSISMQISEGMKYLSRQKFVHRDLACRNCLVGSNLVVKIADFGMSRDIYSCDYYKVGETKMLPIRWMSPESIVFGKFTQQSDVWSYDVVLWEIYTYGKQPYYGYSNEKVLRFISTGILLSIPENCPDEVYDIMKACWENDIKKRITFTKICVRLSELTENVSQPCTSTLPRPPPSPISIDHLAMLADKTVDDDTDDEKAEDFLVENDVL